MNHKLLLLLEKIFIISSFVLLSFNSVTAQTVISDDFNVETLDGSIWTFIDVVGDCSYQLEGYNTGEAFLKLIVPGGQSHDVWTLGNKSARIMQNVDNSNFEIETKYLSTVTQEFQMQGMLVEADESNFIRTDFYSNGTSIFLFVATFTNGIPLQRANIFVADSHTDPFYLRIKRTGDAWHVKYSLDGSNYSSAVNFDFPLEVSKAGVFAANHASPPENSPANTVLVDYFFNTDSPIDPEDEVEQTPVFLDGLTLLSDKRIYLEAVGSSFGNYFSNEDIIFSNGWYATHNGNFTALDKIKINRRKTVDGDVTAGGEVIVNGTVTGSVNPNQIIEAREFPELNYNAGTENINISAFSSRSLEPGSYGKIKLKPFSTLYLSAGNYFFKELQTSMGTNIVVDVSVGNASINITKKLKFGVGTEVEILPQSEGNSDKVTFNSMQHGSINLFFFTRFYGNLIAPEARVNIYSFAKVKGAIAAKYIYAANQSIILSHESTQMLPKNGVINYDLYTEDDVETPVEDYTLSQNYPNPFNPSTTISFTIPEKGLVQLEVFDMLGQKIETLVNSEMDAGSYDVNFTAKNLSSGIYFYRLKTNSFIQTNKMILTK